MSSRRHVKAYKNADREAFAESDDPHALIAVLFDELLRHMNQFASDVENGKIKTGGASDPSSRALTILYGLQSSLNFENGGDIASNLFRLYEFARQQILHTMRSSELEGTKAAIAALADIRDAWQQMDRTGIQTRRGSE